MRLQHVNPPKQQRENDLKADPRGCSEQRFDPLLNKAVTYEEIRSLLLQRFGSSLSERQMQEHWSNLKLAMHGGAAPVETSHRFSVQLQHASTVQIEEIIQEPVIVAEAKPEPEPEAQGPITETVEEF